MSILHVVATRADPLTDRQFRRLHLQSRAFDGHRALILIPLANSQGLLSFLTLTGVPYMIIRQHQSVRRESARAADRKPDPAGL